MSGVGKEAIEAAANVVEAHPFVTLVVKGGRWVATCDGCDEVLEGGSDMDVACRSHSEHLASKALEAAAPHMVPDLTQLRELAERYEAKPYGQQLLAVSELRAILDHLENA